MLFCVLMCGVGVDVVCVFDCVRFCCVRVNVGFVI